MTDPRRAWRAGCGLGGAALGCIVAIALGPELLRPELRTVALIALVATAPALAAGRYAAPLATLVACGLGHVVLRDGVPLPPRDVVDWPALFVAPAALLGVVQVRRPLSPASRWGSRAALCVALAWLLLRPLAHPYGSPEYGLWFPATGSAWLEAIGGGVLLLGFVALIDRVVEHEPGPAAPLGLLAISLLGSVAIGLSGSGAIAMLALLPVAGLLALTVLALVDGRHRLLGAAPALALALAGAGLNARLYASLPTGCLALLAAAPAGILLAQLPALRARPRARIAVGVAAACLLGGASAGLAWHLSPSFDVVLGAG